MKNLFKSIVLTMLLSSGLARADSQLTADGLNLVPATLPTCDTSGQLRVDASFGIWICNAGTWTTLGGGGGTWGSITGTLSNQTDLQSALDAKVPTSRTVTAGSPLTGGGALSSNITINCPTASGSQSGCLSSSSFTTFNNKEPAITSGTTAQFWRGDKTFSNDLLGPMMVTRTALGANPAASSGILLRNTTNAAANAQQASPTLEWEGRGWSSNGGGSSTPVKWRSYVTGVQGAPTSSNFILGHSLNNAAFTDIFTITANNPTYARPYLKFDGMMEINLNGPNSVPGTVDHLILNSTGGSGWLSFKFNGIVKGGVGMTSSGTAMDFRAQQHSFYVGSTNPNSQSLMAQVYSGGFYNSAGNFNGGNVTAGSANQTPPATLNSFGSLALKGGVIESSVTLSNTLTAAYCDTTNSAFCSGTPSTSCASTTFGAACTARSAIGCSNQIAGNCGSNSNTDSGTCTGANPACVWDTSACSAYNNDVISCNAAGFPSGSQCSFAPSVCTDFGTTIGSCNAAAGCSAAFNGNCSDFDANAGQCAAHAADGETCTQVQGGNCNDFNDAGGDGTACAAAPAPNTCSYDSGSGVCSGTYYTSCSGNYFTSPTDCVGSYSGADGVCSGSFATGNCSGGDYGTCGGSALCNNLTGAGSGTCNGESGCAWATGLTVSLPSITSISAGDTARMYEIKKIDAGSGTVLVQPNGTDTIEGASSVTLARQYSGFMLHPIVKLAQCSAFNNNQSECQNGSTHPGCSFTLASCGDFAANEATCNAQSGNGCSWNAGVPACEGTYTGTNGSCSGTYPEYRRWMSWANTNPLANSATLNFPSISAGAAADLTITVTGAVAGDMCTIGLPAGINTGLAFDCIVTATNTVTVRATNATGSSIDPASATFQAKVHRY